MAEAHIRDFARPLIGRYAGALKDARAEDRAAHPIRALASRKPGIDRDALDDCITGISLAPAALIERV